MKLNRREMVLAWVTGLVALAGLTYVLCEPVFVELKQLQTKLDVVNGDIETEQDVATLGPRWEAKLTGMLEKMPRHAQGVDVLAGILQEIEQHALRSGFVVKSRLPSDEEVLPEYSSRDILYVGEFKSSRHREALDGLLQFIYDVQSPSAMIEVGSLKIDRSKDSLRVRVTFSCVYGRLDAGDARGA